MSIHTRHSISFRPAKADRQAVRTRGAVIFCRNRFKLYALRVTSFLQASLPLWLGCESLPDFFRTHSLNLQPVLIEAAKAISIRTFQILPVIITTSTSSNNQHILIACVSRVFRPPGHHKPLGLCENDIVFRFGIHKRSNVRFRSP